MVVDNEENDISGKNEAINFDEEKWHFESSEADRGVTFNLLGRQISCFSHCSLLYIGSILDSPPPPNELYMKGGPVLRVTRPIARIF